jgi:2-keto-4-pentenoate hydratase/2-oxohepta-3-ene-1,7-dioic acid hydratase in catechol pathway
MRLIGYRDELDLPAVGVVRDDRVVPVAALVDAGRLPEELRWLDLAGLLEADPDLAQLREAVGDATDRGSPAASVPTLALGDLRPTPAVARPGKIVCIGLNYRAHVLEQGGQIPDRPLMFSKFANAVVGDGEPVIRPAGTRALDLEAELGVVVGRTARRVDAADAWSHVAGYVAVNDVTARDWQGNKVALAHGEHGDGQWLRAKGSDTFCPMSATFVTLDEIGRDPSLPVRSWRVPAFGPNAGVDVAMQDALTSDLIFDIPTLIAFVSASITLEPGDVIVTGTPSGVGVFRDPPVYLEPGDVVRVAIEGVGSVQNPVVDAAGRAPAGSPAELVLARTRTDARG